MSMITKANVSDFTLDNSLEDGLSPEEKETIEKEFLRVVERINRQYIRVFHCKF